MVAYAWPHGLYELIRSAQQNADQNDLHQWSLAPSIVMGVALLIGLYLYGIHCSHNCSRPPWTAIASYLLGCLVLFLTLSSPLDEIGDEYLFSAHMTQHMLLAEVVPPLLLIGIPAWLIAPIFNIRWVAISARVLTKPIVAFLAFNICFYAWHWPPLYNLAMADEGIHIVQHLTFLSTGVLFWFPVLVLVPTLPGLSYPGKVVYLFANTLPCMLLGAVFVFSSSVIYLSYLEAPRLFGISALTDQQIGGLIMWIPGGGIYLVALSIVFLRWFLEGERDQ